MSIRATDRIGGIVLAIAIGLAMAAVFADALHVLVP
jgi:hypothetical protein